MPVLMQKASQDQMQSIHAVPSFATGHGVRGTTRIQAGNEPACFHTALPAESLGQFRTVRNHNQRRSFLLLQLAQQVTHVAGRLLVQIAGRLIGQQQLRLLIKARANAVRCRSPPDNSAGRWLMRSCSPTRASNCSARSRVLRP